jgi:hypothetical protein
MRASVLLVVLMVIGYGETWQQTLILLGDTNKKAVRIESLKLELKLAQNASMERLFEKHRLTFSTQSYGHFHLLIVKPIRSLETKNALLLAFGSQYTGMFFIEEGRAVKRTAVSRTDLSHTAHQPKSIWETMDAIEWAWLMIFLLALTGLSASIIQRKKMFVFKKVQTHFKQDQDRMDQEIETLQGEKNA